MTQIKQELAERLTLREQRLRELRDMTQDRQERDRVDAELRDIQLTLDDLQDMDEAQLRALHARHVSE